MRKSRPVLAFVLLRQEVYFELTLLKRLENFSDSQKKIVK